MSDGFWRYAIPLWIVAAAGGAANSEAGVTGIVDFFDWLQPVLLGIGTVALAIFTWLLWVATSTIWKHTRVIERAYVKISHTSPGVLFENHILAVNLQVKNAGRTPATVTDVIVGPVILPKASHLPKSPNYKVADGFEFATGFLRAHEHMTITARYTLSGDELAKVQAGDGQLFMVGYVDYIDAFNVRHRSGYGRRYDPRFQSNNLVFVPERAYHYDRIRPIGEGRDWDGG